MAALRERFGAGEPFGLRDGRRRLILDAPAAGELNAILAELRRLGRASVAAPLEYGSDASGRRWGLSQTELIYVKLSGSSSPYSWSEAYRVAGGGTSALLAGGRSGTAYEANGVSGLGGTYATVDWMPASADWRFQAVRDGAGGSHSVGSVGDIPSCFCDPIPYPLTMLSCSTTCNFGMFQNTTLTYQPPPDCAASLRLPSGFYSWPNTFPDSINGGAEFFYYMTCEYSQFTLTRIYCSYPPSGGAAFHDAVLYTWLLGGANTCTPFSLTSGTAFAGSDASCFVAIYDASLPRPTTGVPC